jgi:glycosyltransferase involved in cell wall biosynthesis
MRVILTSPAWDLSGVNTVSATLVKELRDLGADAEMLLTDPMLPSSNGMPPIAGVPLVPLPGARAHDIRHNWRRLVSYLESQAPCIYLPNYDMIHSCVSARLSPDVVVVGVVHCDDPVHYEHVGRVGSYWNAIVAVSEAIASHVRRCWPALADRTSTIRNGVSVPPVRREVPSDPLRILYAGRVIQHQKRVLDLPPILAGLLDAGVPAVLTVAGSGPEDAALAKAGEALLHKGALRQVGTLAHDALLALMETQDIIMLTSAFEGLPMVLIEAMARGCIPVVTDVTSGIPELVRQGENGFRVPIGDTQGFVRCLAALASDPVGRARLRQAARSCVEQSFSGNAMAAAYHDLFSRLLVERVNFRRLRGPIVPPDWARPLLDQQRWPNRLRVAVRGLVR